MAAGVSDHVSSKPIESHCPRMRPALILYFVKLNIVFICCSSLISVISGKMEQDNFLSLGMLFCGISIFCHPHLLKQFNLEIQILLINEELDSVLSPINLQGQTGCNCKLQPINLQGQTGYNCDLQPINLQGQTGCICDLQPINLQGQTGCNCDLQPINYVCLVDITLQYSIVDCEKWAMGQR